MVGELPHLLVARLVTGFEQAQVRDVGRAAVDQRRRDHVPLARRDVDHPADPAGLRDPVELAVVGVHRVQGPADGDHAVPGPVGFEVLRVGVGDRVRLLEGAQVGDHPPGAVPADLDDAVRDAGHAV